jgi:hypothetical protein
LSTRRGNRSSDSRYILTLHLFFLQLTLLFIEMAPAAFPNLPQDVLDNLEAWAFECRVEYTAMLAHQKNGWDRVVLAEVCAWSEIESLEALLAKVENMDKSVKKGGEDE